MSLKKNKHLYHLDEVSFILESIFEYCSRVTEMMRANCAAIPKEIKHTPLN